MSDRSKSLMDRWRALTRASKVMLVVGSVLLVLAATGMLRADRGLVVTSEQAVEIATQQVDFAPQDSQVRLLRQGFNLRPVWAVSLSIPGEGSNDFERLATVEVDAVTGTVLRLVNGS